MRVVVHIVSFDSARHLAPCVAAVAASAGFKLGEDLSIEITDNASTDASLAEGQRLQGPGISVYRNEHNIGFCGAHNQGVYRFLRGGADLLLVLNPDLALAPTALKILALALSADPLSGMATPKLLRADEDLKPLEPPVLDAAGMIMCASLRHFDRGAGEQEHGQYATQEYVFGGTGACLLLTRSAVEALLLDGPRCDAQSVRICPALAVGRDQRAPLFDEAFFAYREDAELAWRAQRLGIKTLFVPAAVGYHVRRVTPERRADLPENLNALSVRNRFLMQLVHFSIALGWESFLRGVLLRNVVVLLGILLWEGSSRRAVGEVVSLWGRAQERRELMRKRAVCSDKVVARSFTYGR